MWYIWLDIPAWRQVWWFRLTTLPYWGLAPLCDGNVLWAQSWLLTRLLKAEISSRNSQAGGKLIDHSWQPCWLLCCLPSMATGFCLLSWNLKSGVQTANVMEGAGKTKRNQSNSSAYRQLGKAFSLVSWKFPLHTVLHFKEHHLRMDGWRLRGFWLGVKWFSCK